MPMGNINMADSGQQPPTPVTHRTDRPASAQAELLPDGSLYVSITSAGSGYTTDAPPAAHLNGTWAARAGTAAPALSVRVGSGGLVEAIEVGCELSGDRPDNGGTGCLRTVGFGLAASWEYTQGRLAFETNYSLAATVQGLDGTWREWSEPALFTTLGYGATAVASAVPPACQEGGVLLTSRSGTISFGLERSVSSSDCWWKFAPEGLSEGTQHSILLHFEPHPDHPDTPISVGDQIFSPVPAASVRVARGVAGVVDETEEADPDDSGDAGGYRRGDGAGAGGGNTHTMSFANIIASSDNPTPNMPSEDGPSIGVTNGVSKIVVVAAGSGCTDGDYAVTFAPALGSEATVVVSGSTVLEARLDWPGSGHTSVPSATVDVAGCDGVELRAVINGLAPLTIGRQGTGYTSAPTVTIEDGGASEPAEVDATLSGEKVSLAFRQTTVSTETTCSTTRATGGGYTSAPGIVLSGGVQDYLMLYEGLTADAPSLKPRTGTLSAARQHDLRYFDAVLPAAGAMRLVHSGSASVHFQVHAVYTQCTCSVHPTRSSSCLAIFICARPGIVRGRRAAATLAAPAARWRCHEHVDRRQMEWRARPVYVQRL